MKKAVLALVLFLAAGLARAVVPQAGLWVIDGELDGKPGRGFQFDIQGSTLVLTFYGYRTDGKATWYQASGPVAADAFSASLEQFEGGTAFGMGRVSAHGTGTAGNVVVNFGSKYKGTITLPGEAPKAISWYNFGRPADPTALLGSYVLERAVIDVPGAGTFDSAANMTATGAMTSDGTTVVQSVRITVNGTTVPSSVTAKLTADTGSGITMLNANGSTSAVRVMRDGDVFTTLSFAADGSVELDTWRRTSVTVQRATPAGAGSVPFGLAIQTLLAAPR